MPNNFYLLNYIFIIFFTSYYKGYYPFFTPITVPLHNKIFNKNNNIKQKNKILSPSLIKEYNISKLYYIQCKSPTKLCLRM